MSSRKLLRAQHRREQQEQRLVIRHRWYAGGVATLLSAALVLTGMSPAVADAVVPVDPATQSAETLAEGEPKPEPEVPAPAPEEEPKPEPEVSAPAPEEKKSEPQADALKTEEITSLETEPETLSLLDEGPVFQPLIAGPETDVTAPYVYWRVTNAGGTLVGGATFNLEGPRTSSSNWTRTVSVTDCVTAPCTGLDRDSDAGEFQVKFMTPSSNPNANGVSTASRYRVQQTAAPAGYQFSDTDWRTIPGSSNTGAWGGTTYNFGDFVNNPLPSKTIRVNKRVLRGSTSFLAGAAFQLYTGASSPTTIVNSFSPSSCQITGVNTFCDITVPGAFTNENYWVVESAVNPSTFALDLVATGPATGNLDAPTRYPGRTGVLSSSAAATINVPLTSSGDSASIGQTTNALKNPTVSPSCNTGLNIALVLDMSTSIDDNENDAYSDAVRDLVMGLKTPGNLITITPITFNSSAQVRTGSLAGVASDTLATNLRTMLRDNNQYQAATNWDAALRLAANTNYDIVLMLTDGAPTQSDSGGADNVRLHHIEQAVLSANAVKNLNIPVIAVGVALPNNAGTNLTAISGKEPGDSYNVTQWSALSSSLREIALGFMCKVPIKVNKTEIPVSGSPRPLEDGWEFSASKLSGSGTLLTPGAKTTTSGTPTVEWIHEFTATGQTATVTIAETPRDGWDFHNVTCTGATPIRSGNSWTITFGLNANITCTVENKEHAGSLKIDKVFAGAGGIKAGQTFSGTYACTPSGPSGSWTIAGDGDTTVNNIPAGSTCTVTETTAGITQSYLVDSSYAWDTVGTVAQHPGKITVGQTATATVTNTTKRVYGSINITKVLAGGITAADLVDDAKFEGTWSCSYSGGVVASGSWERIGAGAATLTATVGSLGQIPLTSVCTADETTPDDSLFKNAAYTWESKNVTVDNATVGASTPASFTVTNTAQRSHTVTLEKQWVNAIQGDTATLSINGGTAVVSTANGNSGSWVDPAKATATARAGERVDFAESLNALSGSTYASTYSCTPSGIVTAGEGGVFSILAMPDADVVCTFTNSNVRGKLTLEKHVTNDDGGDAADTAWTLNAAGIVSIRGTEGQTAVTNAFVPVGSYTLTETGGPDGYTFTGIICTVNDGEPFALVKNDAGQYVVPVAVQQDVLCEFQNDDIAPTLTLKKHVVNTGGGTQPATAWTLTAAEDGQPAVISEQGATTDGGASAVTQTVTVKAGVGYELTESFLAGYTPGTWSCGQADVTPGGVVTLDLAQNVTCEITNTAIRATGSHLKTVKSLSQAEDGTWTIVYTVVVTNTSAASTLTYDLDDTLRFGSGIQVVDASWTGPSNATPVPFASEWSTTLADDVQLTKAVGTHTYEVTARATIAAFPDADDTWQDCVLQTGENGTGFLNSSALTIGDSTVVEYACDRPEFPDVVKTGLASTQDPVTGAWTISYRIDVTVTGGAGDPAVATVVEDVLPAAPGDWTLVGTWSVENVTGTPAVDLSLAPGSHTIWTGSIPAGATYGYTVTGVLQPSAEAEAIGPCVDEEGGLVNTAIVTSGAASANDDGCAATEAATVTVEKAATSVSQNADGTWLVTYLVSVANDSDELTAIYDLTDAPLFGADATAGPVRWAPSNAAGELLGALTSATPLADDKPLAASGADYYLVQITADIAAEAWTEDEDGVLGLPCPAGWERGAQAGGLLNGAYTTSGDQDDEAFGCIEPKLPTILKTPVGAVQLDDPSQWAVTYTLTVTGKGTDTFYDLSDVPDFADGVSIVGPGSATLVGSDDDPLEVPVPEGPASVPFVTDVALGGSATDVWRVTWIVDVPTQILPPELRECGDQGGGFDNRAILTVDDVIQTSDACLPIDEKVYPDMEKTVTGLSRNPETRVWEITYRIDVTLTDDAQLNPKGLSSEYTLFEELDYPGIIGIVDASWSGHDSGDFADGAASAYLAQDEPIAAGATHTYIVTVHATLATGAISQSSVTVGCNTVEGTRQIGFFNTATLTYDDLAPVVREACTPPVYPTMAKTPGAVTENGDGTQTIEYFVTVTAPAPVAGQPVTNVIYALREAPAALPSTVSLVGSWHAERVGDDTPVPSATTWNGVGAWNLQAIAGFSAADRTAGRLVHTYRVWADVTVSGVPATMPAACDDGGADGIPMWNTVSLAIGEQSISAEACVRVNYDDVEIVKTSTLPEGQTSVEPGDQFDYVLTVTNLGTRDATGVRITDTTINDRLDVLSVTVPGFTFTGGITGNDVDLTLNEPLGVGESVVVTVRVEFLPQTAGAPEFVEPGDPLPQAPDPIEVLTNTACVIADGDSVSENNCSTWVVPARDITAVVYTTCQSDAAMLGYFVRTSGNLAGLPVSGSWTTVDEPQVAGHSMTFDPFFAGANGFGREIAWPGVEFTPAGVAIDYPGWRPLQASDYTADGQYIDPFDGLPMTAQDIEDKIFNGLILDDSELDYAWRGNTTIVFSVNPEITLNASYPPASAECFQARQSEVQIEKTASVEKTDPGKSFTYTLEVANVSPDGAAESVVVTDAIPADLRITDVTWPGKGDGAAYPNWETCAVTGQNAGGYGGTLECVLFGPLQPLGANDGASAAPTITLAATVNPASKASVITNVAVVDYHTFGDPSDPGRDSDDATVMLSALPATGGSPMLPLVMLGFLALMGGAAMLVVMRRRRGEKQATV